LQQLDALFCGARAIERNAARRSQRRVRIDPSMEEVMALFIVLANFTEQGIRNVKDSPKRAEAFRDMAKKCGVTVKETFWTLGQYDIVAILEAPDDVSITALGLSLGTLGNVRTQTLRAFSSADIKSILGKMV
jgi:uncharacterized protein with GYD domain